MCAIVCVFLCEGVHVLTEWLCNTGALTFLCTFDECEQVGLNKSIHLWWKQRHQWSSWIFLPLEAHDESTAGLKYHLILFVDFSFCINMTQCVLVTLDFQFPLSDPLHYTLVSDLNTEVYWSIFDTRVWDFILSDVSSALCSWTNIYFYKPGMNKNQFSNRSPGCLFECSFFLTVISSHSQLKM